MSTPDCFCLRDKENHEVFVHVVEIPSVTLVEVIREVGLAVVVGVHSGVLAHNTERVSVPDAGENAGRSLRMAGDTDSIDFSGAAESEISSAALPEGDSFRVDEFGVLVMESPGLKEDVRRRLELREHDDVLKVARCKPLLAADVEQGGHSGETVNVQTDGVRSVADEIRVEDCRGCAEVLVVLGVKPSEKIDRARAACASDSTARVLIVHGLDNHVVDGAHDETVHLHCEGLLNLIEKHGDECVELSGAREALLDLTLSNGAVNLEGRHLVEELGFDLRRMEDVGVVACAVSEFPILVLGGDGHLGSDFLNNRAVLPSVTKDRGGRTAIGAVDENHLANVVHKGLDVLIEGGRVENRSSNINHIGEVFVQNSRVAEELACRGIYEFGYLFNFHILFSFQWTYVH